MNRTLTLLLVLFLTCCSLAQTELKLPKNCNQLVVVTNTEWDQTVATMRRFERKSEQKPWTSVGKPVTVNLGRTGLAWGRSPLMEGFTPPKNDHSKREGDGRSPAGVFPFLKAFGHPRAPEGYSDKNLPFLKVTDQQCVDDKTSEYYNQIVAPAEVGGVTWNSAEKMKIDLYKLGLVVGHNCPKADPGMGSCIFFHLQAGPGKPTSGCTSMEPGSLRDLVLWMQADEHPTLVQMPSSVYKKLGAGFPRL